MESPLINFSLFATVLQLAAGGAATTVSTMSARPGPGLDTLFCKVTRSEIALLLY